jgi:hypothetical protein
MCSAAKIKVNGTANYRHLLARHIPDAQSFPFLQVLLGMPEPVDIIIFIAASLELPVEY